MKNFINEFKSFAMKGNVVDLAVGVIIGGAFGKIISSLVGDVIMPLIGLLLGKVNFSTLSFGIGDAKVMYGNFIQSAFDFIVVAFVIFLAIKALNSFKKKEAAAPEAPAAPSKEVVLLSEIRDLLKRQ